MKEDAPPPKKPPRKRRMLERAPDYWLAVWANDKELSEADRERVQAIREERKHAQEPRKLGIIADHEGVTQSQLDAISDLLSRGEFTEIHHPWVSRSLHSTCRAQGVPVIVHKDVRNKHDELKQVVLNSMRVIVAPRSAKDEHTPAWEAMRYSKHRSLPVTMVLPNGSVP